MIITLQTITAVRAVTANDAQGNPVSDWSTATRHTEDRVSVQPVTQTESTTDARDLIVTNWRVLSDGGVDVDVLPTDRIEWAGDTYEVIGDVGRFRDPIMGDIDHVEFAIRKVSG